MPAATIMPGIAAPLAPLPPYLAIPVVSPSSAHERAGIGVLDSAAERAADADAARREGLALHALLQHLDKVDRALWPLLVPKADAAAVAGRAGAARPDRRAGAVDLEPARAGDDFCQQQSAEVPFLVDGLRGGAPVRLAGRIDRLIVDDSMVLVVDYKSDAAVPASPDRVPQSYRTQLGLYALVAGLLFPGRLVRRQSCGRRWKH